MQKLYSHLPTCYQMLFVRLCLTICAGRNLEGGSFYFFAWNLPIMIQHKPIFKIFEKYNMAAVMTIITDNLQLKYRKYGWDGNYGRDRNHGQNLFHFSMKVDNNDATKTHISNFPKIRYGDNLLLKYRIVQLFLCMKLTYKYNGATKTYICFQNLIIWLYLTNYQ